MRLSITLRTFFCILFMMESSFLLAKHLQWLTPEICTYTEKIGTAPVQKRTFNAETESFCDAPPAKETTPKTPPAAPPHDRMISPDGQYRLAFFALKEIPKRTIPIQYTEPKEGFHPTLTMIDYIKPGDPLTQYIPTITHIPTGHVTYCANTLIPDMYAMNGLSWMPDGKHFYFEYNARGHQLYRVIEGAPQGNLRVVIEEKPDTFFCYSSKKYLHYLPATNDAIWMSERNGWNHLYLYDWATGTVKNPITSGNWVVKRVDHVDQTARKIYFYAVGIVPNQNPYYAHYCSINFDGSDLRILTEGDGNHTIAHSPDRRFFLDTYQRVDRPPVRTLRRLYDGKALAQITNTPFTPGPTTPIRFSTKGRDGVTDIHGILFPPKDLDGAKPKTYPILECIYAGPHGTSTPLHYGVDRWYDRYVKEGFAVVVLDGMGTNWRSKAFHDVAWQNLVDAGLPDRILWIKALAKKYPALDIDRVGIFGGSAGGQNAMGAVCQYGDFYKAAAASCGCHDNRLDKIWWNEQWMGKLGPHYEAQSNVTLAKDLEGKLLLSVGLIDTNVDPVSTWKVVTALNNADKDYELVILPESKHCETPPYLARREKDFFKKHLMP